MDDDVEVPAMHIVVADEPGLVGLVDGRLQMFALADEFAAHVDIGRMATHGGTGDQAAFDQQMRFVAQDLAVLTGAGLGFIRIDDEIMRALADDLRHERPL